MDGEDEEENGEDAADVEDVDDAAATPSAMDDRSSFMSENG